jgi:hypothetical protein
MNAIFQLLRLCGETRKLGGGVASCVLHLILPWRLSECPRTIPTHTSAYPTTKNLNVYFHQDFYAGESENQGL